LAGWLLADRSTTGGRVVAMTVALIVLIVGVLMVLVACAGLTR
jgi:hypothetical protein